jgi:hypothetical protein
MGMTSYSTMSIIILALKPIEKCIEIVIFLTFVKHTVFAQIQALALILLNNNKCGLYSSATLDYKTRVKLIIDQKSLLVCSYIMVNTSFFSYGILSILLFSTDDCDF